MRRKILKFAATVSLLLCVATVVMWVRSYWYQTQFGFSTPAAAAMVSVGTNNGKLMVLVNSWPSAPQPEAKLVASLSASADPQTSHAGDWVGNGYYLHEELGFGIAYPARTAHPTGLRRHVAVAPLWFVTTVLVLLPAVRWGPMLRRMPKPGCCLTCGYDLRASPGRCPECGGVPESASGGAA